MLVDHYPDPHPGLLRQWERLRLQQQLRQHGHLLLTVSGNIAPPYAAACGGHSFSLRILPLDKERLLLYDNLERFKHRKKAGTLTGRRLPHVDRKTEKAGRASGGV